MAGSGRQCGGDGVGRGDPLPHMGISYDNMQVGGRGSQNLNAQYDAKGMTLGAAAAAAYGAESRRLLASLASPTATCR